MNLFGRQLVESSSVERDRSVSLMSSGIRSLVLCTSTIPGAACEEDAGRISALEMMIRLCCVDVSECVRVRIDVCTKKYTDSFTS
jgi:hypothetical protein